MKIKLRQVYFQFPWCLLILSSSAAALACSTFVLEDGPRQIYAHHLDTYGDVPGLVVVNPRHIDRQSVSWEELITGNSPEASVSWVSRWGSITFNTWGIGYPDGGLNERGLFIQEMSLPGSIAPAIPGRPRLFAPVWMQYVLDNFERTREVIGSALENNIQGSPSSMEWHFLVADSTGDKAIIEFIDGKVVVNDQASVSVPLLCNAEYADELTSWKRFSATNNGSLPAGDSKRFIRGADTLERTSGLSSNRTAQVLEALRSSTTQWTYVFDPWARQVRYRTRKNPNWRVLTWNDSRFAPGPVLAWEINDGNPEHWFQPMSPVENEKFVQQAIDALLRYAGGEKFEQFLRSQGGSSTNLRRHLSSYSRWQRLNQGK